MLDSVSSPITRRVYNLGLDEFMAWFMLEARPAGFAKATVTAWQVALEARGLGPISINLRITAVWKMAVEAAAWKSMGASYGWYYSRDGTGIESLDAVRDGNPRSKQANIDMIKRRDFGKRLVRGAVGAGIAGGINPDVALAQAGRAYLSICPDHMPSHPDDPGKLQAYAFGYAYINALIHAVNSEV